MRAEQTILCIALSSLLCTSASLDNEEMGTMLIDTGTSRGRATVATQNFSIGEIVLRENPILAWDKSDSDLLRQFFAASPSVKAEVENLAHLPLNSPSPRVQRLRHQAVKLVDALAHAHEVEPAVTTDEAHKLLLIANTNLHHYFGHAPRRAADAALEYKSAGAFALFPRAAKVNHACAPNVMYTTQTADGRIQYTAIRQIAEGDEISFSYLGEDGEMLSRDRREELLAERDIRCECARCLSPDWWRGFKCPKSGCRGVAFPTLQVSHWSDTWHCTSCGELHATDMTERLQQEASIRSDIEAFTELCHSFDELMPDPAQLERILDHAQSGVAITHSLICQGLLLLSKVFASYAHRLERGQNLDNKPLSITSVSDCRLRSAAADLRAVLHSELVAAGQHAAEWDAAWSRYRQSSGDELQVTVVDRSPLWFCSRMAFEAGQSLLGVPESERDPALLHIVGRYLGLMHARYGAEDQDVLDIARAVEGACTPAQS